MIMSCPQLCRFGGVPMNVLWERKIIAYPMSDQSTSARNDYPQRNGSRRRGIGAGTPGGESGALGLVAATGRQQRQQVRITFARAQEARGDLLAHQKSGLKPHQPHVGRERCANAT